ncbi:hypothetical protein [Zunongwangia endophytica]|uniref:Tissue inhibitor of metalloproteinase n=1 Tax=Zunongwangia endophytica TaxID=1808945 RepID=A0ABV8H4W6_9FLAO|nr:hypothetical protein [Zunongwangia endophytica]MDN3593471.1 hypothetical protein [Zunongwangia endophytica]
MRLISTLIFMLTLNNIYACTCESLGKIDINQFNEYDLIATGKILSVDFGEFTQTIEIGIHKIFKGKVKKMTVNLLSSSQSEMCGIFPKVGEKWLIYANGKDIEFSTDLCTRTQNMTRTNDKEKRIIKRDLKFLKQNSTRNKNYCQQWL